MSELDALVRKVNKDADPNYPIMVKGSELKNRKIPRISSGSLTLDLVLGGGWPLNQWNEIVGHPSNGKTVLALKTLAAAQKENPNHETLWIASEEFVPDWAEKLGVDLDQVTVANTNSMETAFQLVVDALESRVCDAIIVDSYPALSADVETERDMTDLSPGLGARLAGKMFRKSGTASRRSLTHEDRDCLLIMINQWRQKIGVMFGDPRTTPGGQNKDYACFTRVEVTKGDWIEHDKKRIGHGIKFKCLKNKTAPANLTGVVDFYYDDGDGPGTQAGDYDTVKEMFFVAVSYDVIEKQGNKYLFNGDPMYDGPHPSKDKAIEALRGDLTMQEEIREQVLRLALPLYA